MSTLFWHPTGPLLRYEDGALLIEDLNPQIKTAWVVGRWAAFRIAAKLFVAACKP